MPLLNITRVGIVQFHLLCQLVHTPTTTYVVVVFFYPLHCQLLLNFTQPNSSMNISSSEGLESNSTGLQVILNFGSSLHFLKNLLYGFVSLKSIQLIVDYIQSKPPGQKTSMDTLTIILLKNLQLIGALVIVYGVLRDCTLDSGELLASILMWPMFNTPDTFIILMFAIAGLNQLLILKPHLIEKDFNNWFKVLAVVIITYAILIDAIMYVNGIYPPIYYGMRHQPKTLDTLIIRDTTVGICFVLTFLIRLKIFLQKVVDSQPDSKVIGDQNILAMLFLITIINLAFGLYGPEQRLLLCLANNNYNIQPQFKVILEVDGVLLLCCWPITIIISNHNLTAFAKRKYRNEIYQAVTFSDRIRGCVGVFTSSNPVHPIIE